jgi:DNA-directed RNA polymerase subunit RPC12/RpoP
MSERLSCERCGRSYAVSDALAGRSFRMRCKGCGSTIAVRPAAATVGPAAPPPVEPPAAEFEVVLEEPPRRAGPPEVAPLASGAPGRDEPLPPLGPLAGAAPEAEVRPRRRAGTGRALALAVALGAAGIAAGYLVREASASPGDAMPARTASRAHP